MREWLGLFLDRMRANFWFIPSVMALGAVVLAFVSVELDRTIQLFDVDSFLFLRSEEGAREVLSTIAGSMITVAGTVFSLTMVVLSLSSQQHGPLTLENFLRDRTNQTIMGTFTSTFIYCLLVLRVTEGGEGTGFIPVMSSLVAVALAMLSLVVLIYFIHHISSSIRADSIINRISHALVQAIRARYSKAEGTPHSLPDVNALPHRLPIHCHEGGYIQLINRDELYDLARNHNIIVHIERPTGDFVLAGAYIGTIYSVHELEDSLIDQVNDHFSFGWHRTQAGDIRYIITQLVSIAVRALSPAMNDPYTAMACIDKLNAALHELSHYDLNRNKFDDEQESAGVILEDMDYAEVIQAMFEDIRFYSREHPIVIAYLHDALKQLTDRISDPSKNSATRHYAEALIQKKKYKYDELEKIAEHR